MTRISGGPQILKCAVCWSANQPIVEDAVTIAFGNALCEDHLDYAPQDPADFRRLVRRVIEERDR